MFHRWFLPANDKTRVYLQDNIIINIFCGLFLDIKIHIIFKLILQQKKKVTFYEVLTKMGLRIELRVQDIALTILQSDHSFLQKIHYFWLTSYIDIRCLGGVSHNHLMNQKVSLVYRLLAADDPFSLLSSAFQYLRVVNFCIFFMCSSFKPFQGLGDSSTRIFNLIFTLEIKLVSIVL